MTTKNKKANSASRTITFQVTLHYSVVGVFGHLIRDAKLSNRFTLNIFTPRNCVQKSIKSAFNTAYAALRNQFAEEYDINNHTLQIFGTSKIQYVSQNGTNIVRTINQLKRI